MMTESPISSSACMIFPPGPARRIFSFAPNAFLQKSIVWAASAWFRAGVTEWYPFGTGFTFFGMRRTVASRPSGRKRFPSRRAARAARIRGRGDPGDALHARDGRAAVAVGERAADRVPARRLEPARATRARAVDRARAARWRRLRGRLDPALTTPGRRARRPAARGDARGG